MNNTKEYNGLLNGLLEYIYQWSDDKTEYNLSQMQEIWSMIEKNRQHSPTVGEVLRVV